MRPNLGLRRFFCGVFTVADIVTKYTLTDDWQAVRDSSSRLLVQSQDSEIMYCVRSLTPNQTDPGLVLPQGTLLAFTSLAGSDDVYLKKHGPTGTAVVNKTVSQVSQG